jgi:hypothetical protein
MDLIDVYRRFFACREVRAVDVEAAAANGPVLDLQPRCNLAGQR